jgi:hypothetical protein
MKAKLLNKKRYSEKVQMKKTIKAHQEKKSKGQAQVPYIPVFIFVLVPCIWY